MTVLRIDSVGGASGDMLLAALADVGADLEAVSAVLRSVLPDPFRIACQAVVRNGIRGRQVRVVLGGGDPGAQAHSHGHPHSHAHAHDHGHPHDEAHAHAPGQDHGHAHEPAHAHPHPHPHGHSHGHAHAAVDVPAQAHRGLNDIRALLETSEVPAPVRALALDAFQRLAEAEARVHGTTPERVHFHEVGAVDSIVDMVGACLALDQLGIKAVQVGPLPLGTGTLRCDHGLMPVPAPATVELLAGHPVTPTDVRAELVTPTGAALLMSWKALAPLPGGALRILRTGYGFGSRELAERPNLVRATLLKTAAAALGDDCGTTAAPTGGAQLTVIETNLDDCSGEWIGALFERLPPLGALDLWTTAAQMKKNRPGVVLSILCRPEDASGLCEQLFREVPTLGVRLRSVTRLALDRASTTVETTFGPVRVKTAQQEGRTLTVAPEFDDCARLAREHQTTPRAVHAAALRQMDA